MTCNLYVRHGQENLSEILRNVIEWWIGEIARNKRLAQERRKLSHSRFETPSSLHRKLLNL